MYRHYFIEQLQPGKRPVGVGQQFIQQAELLGGQGLHLVPAADGVGVVIQHDVPRRDLPFVHNAGAAQNGTEQPVCTGVVFRHQNLEHRGPPSRAQRLLLLYHSRGVCACLVEKFSAVLLSIARQGQQTVNAGALLHDSSCFFAQRSPFWLRLPGSLYARLWHAQAQYYTKG